MTRAPRSLALAATVAAAALAIGFGISTVTTEPSTAPTTTAATTPNTDVATGESVQRLIDEWTRQGRGGVSAALAGSDDDLTVAAGEVPDPRRDRGPGLGVQGREPVEDVRRRDAPATRCRRDLRTR